MRKAKLAIFLLLLFCLVSTSTVLAAAPQDIQYHWAGTYINTLLENGILHGYEDGRFKPSRYISKEEICVLLAYYAKAEELIKDEELAIDESIQIPDVKNKWSLKEVQYMYRNGIAGLDENGLFQPQSFLTRGDMAQIVYNFYKHFDLIEESDLAVPCTLTDISDHPAETAISELYKIGVISGYEDNTYLPDKMITRAEMATILYMVSKLEPVTPEITLPRYNVIQVPYISQLHPIRAVVGCEGTSLLMGLQAKGYALNTDLKTFLDAMPKHESNPAKGFVGSPYRADLKKRTRTTIHPTPLSNWANRYGNVVDFSGSSVEELRAELLLGNPVVVYATMGWEKPFYRTYDIEGEEQVHLSNNHVVLASGYDMDTNQYYISDPYNSEDTTKELEYWIDGYTFERIYQERKHAVVIQ